jgi:diguanylate cyclase (GGDEF)-like protein
MPKSRILLVDDEAEMLKVLESRLTASGYATFTAGNAKEVFSKISQDRIDLIILDINLPEMDGFQIKDKLNENVSTAHIPVIFLTGRVLLLDKIKGLNSGADDYMIKPFDSGELLARINVALKRKDYYESISMHDGLTGLENITYFNAQFTFFFNVAKRYSRSFSLALIDLDDFKSINDKNGHLGGDFILCEFARLAKLIFRNSDIVTRYGGDEFAVIMPDTNFDQASRALERLKVSIANESHIFKTTGGSIPFSVSTGIAEYQVKDFSDKSQLFELADKRLYEAKKHKPQPQ